MRENAEPVKLSPKVDGEAIFGHLGVEIKNARRGMACVRFSAVMTVP